MGADEMTIMIVNTVISNARRGSTLDMIMFINKFQDWNMFTLWYLH